MKILEKIGRVFLCTTLSFLIGSCSGHGEQMAREDLVDYAIKNLRVNCNDRVDIQYWPVALSGLEPSSTENYRLLRILIEFDFDDAMKRQVKAIENHGIIFSEFLQQKMVKDAALIFDGNYIFPAMVYAEYHAFLPRIKVLCTFRLSNKEMGSEAIEFQLNSKILNTNCLAMYKTNELERIDRIKINESTSKL